MQHAHASRLGLAWTRVRDSLWLAPSLSVLIGAALAIVAVETPTPPAGSPFAGLWLFGGGAEGARGVLSTIAGSLITVTGVVFSVTIVALQLASSQFTPRLLRSFVADRVNQVVLGIFIGTFTYTLLVLRTIESAGPQADTFVPQIGVTLALVLLLVSIGALIVFVNHSARSVQASVILHRETQRTLERIDVLFPKRVGEAAQGASADQAKSDHEVPTDAPAVVHAAASGYLQAVHGHALWAIPGKCRVDAPLVIRMELHVGGFTFPGKPLASVWPAHLVTEAVANAIRGAFVLGPERTPEQDVEYGIMELSDIGVRALSPGINDPTTAMHCIDRLSELLAALSARHRPVLVRTSPDERVRLIVQGTSFERAAGLAFDQIRHYGASSPPIVKKLLDAIENLAPVVAPEDRGTLVGQIEAVLRAARRALEDPVDLAAVEELAQKALANCTREVAARASVM